MKVDINLYSDSQLSFVVSLADLLFDLIKSSLFMYYKRTCSFFELKEYKLSYFLFICTPLYIMSSVSQFLMGLSLFFFACFVSRGSDHFHSETIFSRMFV